MYIYMYTYIYIYSDSTFKVSFTGIPHIQNSRVLTFEIVSHPKCHVRALR